MQMITVRLKFTKGEEVKYISHLDLMRTFQRAIRRSGLPVAYSSGFNPHQEISFGAPLSLGVTSSAEFVDIKLVSEMYVGELKERLNPALPRGIQILDGRILPEKFKSAMSLVTHARYSIRMLIDNISADMLQSSLAAFMEQAAIPVMKEQPKKGFELKEIDIKPLIVSIKVMYGGDGEFFLNCMLKSGSQANLKPELLVKAFGKFADYAISGVKINREAVYTEQNGEIIDLLDYKG